MNAPQKTFKKLDFDLDAMMEAVTAHTQETKVPTLVMPQPVAVKAPVPPPETMPVTEPVKPKSRTKRTRFIRSAVDLPDYLVQAIHDRSYRTKRTKKSIILQAFKDAGFTVDDKDINEVHRREP